MGKSGLLHHPDHFKFLLPPSLLLLIPGGGGAGGLKVSQSQPITSQLRRGLFGEKRLLVVFLAPTHTLTAGFPPL